MEVLHTYNGCYPFGRKKDSNNTFVQLIKENLTEEDIHLFKQMTKIYKSLINPHFIRLMKMLREDDKLYFVYEYQQISVHAYVDAIHKNVKGSLSRDKYKILLIQFKSNVDQIIDILIKQQIKTDVLLNSLACVRKQDQSDGFMLKVFIDMDAEYLSLIQHNYRPKNSKKKDRSSLNQEFLSQFYQAERKRLMLDFQELVENVFGNIHDTSQKKQFPNFKIQGTKLVFVQPQEKHININNQNQISGQHKFQKVEKRVNKSNEQDKNCGNSNKMLPSDILSKQRSVPTNNNHEQKSKQRKQHPITPIIDFDQSFEPQFIPEQFIKEKTYIYEENDYLDSLEEQIIKMHQQKKLTQQKNMNNSNQGQKFSLNNFSNNNDQRKEDKKIGERQRKQSKQVSPVIQRKQMPKQIAQIAKNKDTYSQGSTQSNNPNNNSNNRSKDNTSNTDSYDKKQKDHAKLNKYKMKIITSHQIEFQGGEQPNVQEIERQIIDGIRTGKININELNNKKKLTVTQKKQIEGEQKKGPQMYNSHREQRNSIDSQKLVNSDHKPDQVKQPFIKTKQIPINKMKNVNQIIQKLGIRSKNATQSKNDQLPRVQPKKQGTYLQSATTPKPEKAQQTRPQRTTFGQIPVSKQLLNEVEKHQKDKKASQKSENSHKYTKKVQEAKSKASQLLSQYRKKN